MRKKKRNRYGSFYLNLNLLASLDGIECYCEEGGAEKAGNLKKLCVSLVVLARQSMNHVEIIMNFIQKTIVFIF